MSSSRPIPPPHGYASWLDYAVEELDTRLAQFLATPGGGPLVDREAMREAARKELLALKQATGAQISTKNSSRIRCNVVSYRKGFVEVVPDIHAGCINLECWNTRPEIDIDTLDVRGAGFPDGGVTGNTELELSVAAAEELAAALLSAIQQLRCAVNPSQATGAPGRTMNHLERFDPGLHGGEAMAFVPVGREFGSPDYDRLIQEDFENKTGVFTPERPHALAAFDRLNVSELQGMTGPAMKSWMDRNHLNAKLAGIVEVCADKYTDEHHPVDPGERSLAINVQTALRELGHDVSVAHAAAVWEYHSATLCAGWMLGAETVDGAIVALVSMAHFAS